MKSTSTIPGLIAACLLLAASVLAQNTPVKLDVDATDAPRKILHARLRIPASPGPVTLLYPKWLPGEHAPTGPITDLVGLKMSAAGKPVIWRRDAEDMCAFHLDVPAGAAPWTWRSIFCCRQTMKFSPPARRPQRSCSS